MNKRLNELLRDWSPPHAPVQWIAINSGCCLVAALLFFLAALDLDEAVEEFYVVYNVVVCVIWFAEVGLYLRYSDHDDPEWWQHGLELAVAAYFAVDCTVELYRWHLLEIQPWHIFVDTSIDFAIYVYYLALAIQAQLRQRDLASPSRERAAKSGVVEAGYVAADDNKRGFV